jgi:hypothetical protein
VECDALKNLRHLVSEGKLEITQILSPPRTLSTILEIALAQSVDGQIHEPFRIMAKKKDLIRGYDTIYTKVKALGHTHKGPIRIVVKDIAEFTPPEWQVWMPLVQNFAFIIREPLLQTRSLINISAMQALSRHRPHHIAGTLLRAIRSDRSISMLTLAEQQAYELLQSIFGYEGKAKTERISSILPCIEQSVFDFNDVSYRLFLSAMESVEDHLLTSPLKHLIVLDGLGLKMAPARTLEKITRTFGWNATPITKWTTGVGSSFYDRNPIQGVDEHGVTNSPWHRRAAMSNRIDPIDPLQDSPPPLSWFTALLRDQICRHSLPTYMRVLLHPSVVSLPTEDELEAPLRGLSSGDRLEDINPVATYATASALRVRSIDNRSRTTLNNLQIRLRSRFDKLYSTAFDVIDAIVAEV